MTTSTFSCMDLNNLEEVSFISGTKYIFTYYVYDENNSPLDITTATLRWRMAYYGKPSTTILEKIGVPIGTPNNEFTVALIKADTENLEGKFIYQPSVKIGIDENIPSQGIITIISAIGALV